ncbi:hypothetical protein WICPIJ_000700 [Wickerhamomyces pijperi]|uniref:Nucleoporin Nup120/160 n=2 Tax=Wickerhamomyces TaxID=599737 RepID=A0A9P8QCB0_WICPI|nr:hypothetical protein WICPIJ_000700 [Wickerhamomyces pijperi]
MSSYTITNSQWDTRSQSKLIELDVSPHLIQRQTQLIPISSDPEYIFRSQLAVHTGVLQLTQSPIATLQYRLLTGLRSIELCPIKLNKIVGLESELFHFKINFPDELTSINCLTVNQFNVGEQDHSIIIDLITKTGLLITCVLRISEFITPSFTNSSDNYQDWCKITNPYGFDIRTPHILHSVNYNYLMVLLKDGGLIGLERRLESGLFNSIEPIVFNDNSYLQSIKSLLKPWNKITINDDPELSMNTVVDVVSFENYLVTVTIEKKLKVWSILTKDLLYEKELSEILGVGRENNNKTRVLAANPTKLLDLLQINEHSNFLTMHFPLQGGVFKIFKIEHSYQEGDFQLIDLGVSLSTVVPDISSSCVISDFKTKKRSQEEGGWELWVLWKSGAYSIVKKLIISNGSNGQLNAQWLDVHSHLSAEKKSQVFNDCKPSSRESWSEFYHHKIFQMGNYSDLILQTSLRIFQTHFQPQADQHRSSGASGSLVDDVTRTITASLDVQAQLHDITDDSSLQTQWRKFDTLCQEFKKQTEESLNFVHLEDTGDVLLANKGSVSLIRLETDLESLSHEQFLASLSKFVRKLPLEVLANVRDSIMDLIANRSSNNFGESTVNAELARIFNSHVSERFNHEALQELVEELVSAGDALQLIERVLDLQQEQEQAATVPGVLSGLADSLLMNLVKDTVEFNSNILFEIIVLLLVLEFDNKEQLQVLITRILTQYKNYEITRRTLSISFNKQGTIDSDTATDITRSLLSVLINNNNSNSNGFLFSSGALLTFVHGFVLKFINSLQFQQLAVIELVNTGNFHIIHRQFWDFLDIQDPIILLIKAYTLLKLGLSSKASKILTNNASVISNYTTTASDLGIVLPQLEVPFDVVSFFHVTLSQYYFLSSQLFSSECQFNEALDLINLSISNESLADADDKAREARFFAQCQISLQLVNFQLIESSLREIHTDQLKRQAISNLIDKLQETNDLKKLTELKLFNEYYIIDELLHSKATTTSDSIRALYFHKVLYAFRMTYKNHRGAVESLYEYVLTRNPDQQIKIELYLTILNLLRTLEENDQWILYKKKNSNKNQYSKKLLDQLNDEYTLIIGGI